MKNMMDSEISFEFQIQLNEITETCISSKIISSLLLAEEKCDLPTKIKKECLYNTFTSYMKKDNYGCQFWIEIISEKDKYNNFVKEWCDHINDILDDQEKESMIMKLINKIPNIGIKQDQCVEYLWSFSGFRKMIKYINIESFKTSYEFEKSRIFTADIKTMKHIIDDLSVHKFMMPIIHRFIKLNTSNASTIENLLGLRRLNIASIQFSIFIFEFLHELYKKQNVISNIISNNKVYDVKDYSIENLPYNEQLYVTFLFSLYVTLETCYRKYDIFKTDKSEISKSIVRNIKRLLRSEWLQEIFIEYFKVYKYISIQGMYTDVMRFLEISLNDSLKINIKDRMYAIASNVLGGYDGLVSSYDRYNTFNTIKKIHEKTGFDVFENFFDNLFKYINQVDIKKLEIELDAEIDHQYSVTQTLSWMIDNMTTINEESKYILAETLFKLINNGLDLLDNFNDELFVSIDNIARRNPASNIYKKWFLKVLDKL
jgi:hypothetical protein